MRKKFINTIENYNLIEENDIIIVGFSGGKDSSLLMHLLNEIKDTYNISLIGAHLNHGVRGQEANRDQEFCKDICNKYKIEFFTKEVNMDNYAQNHNLSKEEAGRRLRKEFFSQIMEKTGANKIALAHNYNDQVETLLMRIFRGTGLMGLRGMDFKEGNIIRPILHIKRSEIEDFIIKENISFVEDSTNFQSDYHRNKIRNIIIPTIKEKLDLEIEDAIYNLSSLSKIDSDFLESYSDYIFPQVAKKNKDGYELQINYLLNLDKAILYRIIRRVFFLMKGDYKDLSYKNILDIYNLALGKSGKFIENIRDIKIRKSYDLLIFQNKDLKRENNIYIDLVEGINNINEKLDISLSFSKEKIDNKNTFSLASEDVIGSLVIRTRENGDKIRPKGLNGSKKLKDIFIDKKIDREKRDQILLLADKEKIIYVLDLVKSDIINNESKNSSYINVTFIFKEE